MPKAFVLSGGSRSQLGLLEQARALGHEVCVVDGSPDAPLLADADHRIVRSFTDVNGVAGDLEAQGIEPVAVATMGSDQAVLPTAQLAELLGLPGLPVATARTVADKRRMRAAFDRKKVRCPKGREAASFEEAEQAFHQLGAPVVVKPVDGSAQRGVTEVRAEGELAPAVDRALAASRAGAIVLEQYLDGDEFTVNGFMLEGEYFPMSVTQRLLHPPPPLGVCIAHRYPSQLTNEKPLFELAHKASRAVGLETGPSYVQVRMRDGQPWAIEVGARLGGGKDAELAKLVTGFDAIRANVLWALGELTRGDLETGEAQAACGQVRFVVAPPGRIVRLDANPALALEGVHEAGFYWREGMTLPPLTSGAERLGYLLLTAPGEDELDALTDQALAALDVEIAVESALV
ncbi:MAG TPA: ATP-grasp domain-containing protein [Gaiellaceae bacterium]|nr:ATP-grasp domain-containing protein [Gaiellaceae bacterium]